MSRRYFFVKTFIKEFCGGVSRREIPDALRRNLFCIIQVIDQGWPQRGSRNVPVKNAKQVVCMYYSLTLNGVLKDNCRKETHN